MDKKSTFKAGLVFGAVLGGIAAFFLAPKSGKENRKLAKEKFDELRAMMQDKKIDEIVAEIYGKASDEGKKLYVKARKELDTKLEDMQDSLADIDKEKYMSLVEDVMARVEDETEATKERIMKLQEYLVNRWDKAQKMAKSDAKELVEDTTKEAKAKK